MPRPFVVVDAVSTAEGALELRRRGERDFMITIAGRVLMTTTFTRSEEALARYGCAHLAARRAPRVLIAGLGLGRTLRAALDVLPADAHVTVVELSAPVVDWCRGPAAVASGDALADPRVEVIVGDVIAWIAELARDPARPRLDAILLDLYVGPGPEPRGGDACFGRAQVGAAHAALAPGGVYAVWGEAPHPPFLRRLEAAGMSARCEVPKGGGVQHVVFVGTRAG